MTPHLFLLLLLVFGGQPDPPIEPRPDWARYYDNGALNGTFLLWDLRAGTMAAYNPARADSAYTPASTFKIFNSLVALETGAIGDVDDTLRWDGVQHDVQAWNADHTMRTAMRSSVVWFYQKLARRIGAERMQNFIDRVGYGNRNIGGDIDQFWLSGKLRITPRQQVEFLKRLYDGDLPFSSRSISKVRDIMVVERTGDYVLRGKTGWGNQDGRSMGWFVGYLERGDEGYLFANCLDMRSEKDAPVRLGITRAILQDLGLIERPD